MTALAWLVEGPYDCVKFTPEPCGVAWKSEMIFAITGFGVEYAMRFSVPPVLCVLAARARPGIRLRPASAAPPATPRRIIAARSNFRASSSKLM